MRQLFFAVIAILSPILLLDRFIQYRSERRPTDCSDEDVPVALTWELGEWKNVTWIDDEGRKR